VREDGGTYKMHNTAQEPAGDKRLWWEPKKKFYKKGKKRTFGE